MAIAVLACQAAGVVGGLLTRPSIADGWYGGLAKSTLTPPPGAFGVVWPILFLLMGIAVYRVWRKVPSDPRAKAAVTLFFGHLVVNVAWSAVFFTLKAPAAALVVIAALAGLIVVLMIRFHPVDRIAAWLLAPYLVWVLFAGYLNLVIAANLAGA